MHRNRLSVAEYRVHVLVKRQAGKESEFVIIAPHVRVQSWGNMAGSHSCFGTRNNIT